MSRTFFSLAILAFSLISPQIFGAGIEDCTYNEFSGKVVARFSANDPDHSRAWVPLELVLCQNDSGTYAIVSHRAVGLGVLWDLPFKTANYKAIKAGDPVIALQWSNQEDDRDAIQALNSKSADVVLLGGTSATQVTVFRKELDNVYSNTLFGGFLTSGQ